MRQDRIQLELCSYRRSFKQPLKTRYGLWCLREGILLKLTDAEGRVGWGEIAPIAEFGTESTGQAIQLCRSLSSSLTSDWIEQIPSSFPACRFGFESAWEMLTRSETSPDPTPGSAPAPLPYSHLLPTGSNALLAWQPLWRGGARTFKWKIGVASLHEELSLFEHLISALPTEARLRLDANGGLSGEAASQWLQVCDRYSVEFLEQPLPPDQFDQMLKLRDRHTTPIALDESVATLDQLEACYQKGWRGIFVIKAAIAGSPSRLRAFCQANPIDIVWSSVFETAIAKRYILDHLIPSVPANPKYTARSHRAIGFGLTWFTDAVSEGMSSEQVWQSLSGDRSQG